MYRIIFENVWAGSSFVGEIIIICVPAGTESVDFGTLLIRWQGQT